MTRSRATTIGNFDGVHLGHLALLRAAREAVGSGGSVTVLAFDPHPISVLRPEQTPPRLTTWQERERLLVEAGADEVIRLVPDQAFLEQSAETFIDDVLNRYTPDVFVEGEDFRFGRGRAGDIAMLERVGTARGFSVSVVPVVEQVLADQSIVRVSSSLIRWLLERGRAADAGALLGRPFTLTGTVVRGDQRGRDLGYPTANLDSGDLLVPADGIYAGMVERDGVRHTAAISIGTKPTFGVHGRACEAHLIDYDGPLDDYGWSARFELTHWLRGQVAFESLHDLIAQIDRDIARVRCMTQRSLVTAS